MEPKFGSIQLRIRSPSVSCSNRYSYAEVAGGREDDKEVVSEEQWFFFTAQQEREARGGKPNRTTASGYWKATGSPGWVYSTSSSSSRGSSSSSSNSNVIGAKKTMVFYKGRAPFGSKTPWKMNEYKAVAALQTSHSISDASSTTPKLRHEMSVCRVYITSAGSSRAFDRRPLSNDITTLLPPVLSHHQQQPLKSPADHTQERISNTIANNINNEEEDDDDELMITNGLQPFWEWERFNFP